MSKTKTNHIQVDASDAGSRVVFTPEDQDRFVMDCTDAVRCAQVGMSLNAFTDEIRALVGHVREWAQRQEGIARCDFSPMDGRFVIYVTPASGRFDLSLSDRLVALDIEIAEKFQHLTCDVLQYPVTEDVDHAN